MKGRRLERGRRRGEREGKKKSSDKRENYVRKYGRDRMEYSEWIDQG